MTQATVSLALRGDLRISERVRQRVQQMARRLGYLQNPYVTALMTHIHSGKKVSERGVMALVIPELTKHDWHAFDDLDLYHKGAVRRGVELGYRVESFFLRDTNWSIDKLDRILEARGIRGVILGPPYRGNRLLPLRWERYACVATGFGLDKQDFDRVANDHPTNVVTAFEHLSHLGYSRIGMILSGYAITGKGLRWLSGFLDCQNALPRHRRIPLFTRGSTEKVSMQNFRQWYKRWHPDALLTISGREMRWLDALKIRVPDAVGLACVCLPLHSPYSGVMESSDILGATVVEEVASKIARNQYGPPSHPKLTLIEGEWREGTTLRKKGRSLPPPIVWHRLRFQEAVTLR